MRRLALAAFPALLLAAGAAGAQAPAGPTGAFKGKVKPGYYDVRSEVLMPGAKSPQVSTRKFCLTDAEIDKLAEESNPSCKTTNFKMAAAGANFRIECKGAQEMIADVAIALAADQYVVDSKIAMKQAADAAPVKLSQRVVNKYVGACPAPAKAPEGAKKK
jgi:hypothetical protein